MALEDINVWLFLETFVFIKYLIVATYKLG